MREKLLLQEILAKARRTGLNDLRSDKAKALLKQAESQHSVDVVWSIPDKEHKTGTFQACSAR